MAPKTGTHCSFPGCTDLRIKSRQRCEKHHALYMREQSVLKEAAKQPPLPTQEHLIAIAPDGSFLILTCTVVQRIPASRFKGRASALKSCFDFLRWRGFQLVQIVTPAAAGAVDAARAESEAGT